MTQTNLNAPKVLRTHCYVLKPNEYNISCPLCGGHNLAWSEFEGHIWCYKCEKDILLSIYNSGVFSGPIPVGCAEILGMSFDRVCIADSKVTKYRSKDFHKTWVCEQDLRKHTRAIEVQHRMRNINKFKFFLYKKEFLPFIKT